MDGFDKSKFFGDGVPRVDILRDDVPKGDVPRGDVPRGDVPRGDVLIRTMPFLSK
jgi:hypothetical protein